VEMNNKKRTYSFRFQNLDIWKKAVEIGMELFDIADELDKRHLHRFAEQLRAAGLSMSNNIAEGSGSTSKREFGQFLNVARRSTFENANMVIIYQMKQLISEEQKEHLLEELDELCRMISGFVRSLRS
jgi:four helix bundle protein